MIERFFREAGRLAGLAHASYIVALKGKTVERIPVHTPYPVPIAVQGNFLPPFHVDEGATIEENSMRLREHIEAHAPEMPEEQVQEFVDQLENVAPEMYGHVFRSELENLDPDDFKEEK